MFKVCSLCTILNANAGKFKRQMIVGRWYIF